MAQINGSNCGNCRFSVVSQGPDGKINFKVRVCKKLPPDVVVVATPQGIVQNTLWPTLDANAHCFSHEPLGAVESLPGEVKQAEEKAN